MREINTLSISRRPLIDTDFSTSHRPAMDLTLREVPNLPEGRFVLLHLIPIV
jgi:hypothetical protein